MLLGPIPMHKLGSKIFLVICIIKLGNFTLWENFSFQYVVFNRYSARACNEETDADGHYQQF